MSLKPCAAERAGLMRTPGLLLKHRVDLQFGGGKSGREGSERPPPLCAHLPFACNLQRPVEARWSPARSCSRGSRRTWCGEQSSRLRIVTLAQRCSSHLYCPHRKRH